MYRDNIQLATASIHNFVLNHGALGDVVTSLPAIIKARMSQVAMTLRVWVPAHQIELIDHLLKPYGAFEVKNLTDFPMKRVEREGWDQGSVSVNSPAYDTHTRNRVHMVDFAFAFLTDSRPENMNERSYPVLAPLGPRTIDEDYVVFPVGATSDNKLFRASVMVPIMRWVLERGYKPVIVGTKTSYVSVKGKDGLPEPIVLRDEADKIPADVLAQCIDKREQTTLLELRDLCGHAKAVVGVDGGTIHIAGTTMTNIIYGLTTTLPKHRYVARLGDPHLNIRYVGPRDLACAGCQSSWLMTTLDFRFCAYGDNLCTEKLHSDDFIDGLKSLGL